ncbi:MAG: hypothetical protein IPP04_17090 [Saprospiraceae bacterium]|nr:hypothetical protein [Saprospiraceae bacterium]
MTTINSCHCPGKSALTHIQNHIYLLGSSRIRPVDAIDLKTNTWTPMESLYNCTIFRQ